MHNYSIYNQWSCLPDPTGTKTSHFSFTSFDIFKLIPLDGGTFLKDNILLQVKRDALGK